MSAERVITEREKTPCGLEWEKPNWFLAAYVYQCVEESLQETHQNVSDGAC